MWLEWWVCGGRNGRKETGNVARGSIGFQSLNSTSKVLKLLLSLKLEELLICFGPVTFWWKSEQIHLACYFWVFQKDKKY